MPANKIDNLSIVIPVYNEEQGVKKVITQLQSALRSLNLEYEIIAVDDGSRDRSYEILTSLEGIKTIKHSSNKGYGAALKTGLKQAKYEWILIIDADGTYPPQAIKPMVAAAREGYDMVVGRRDKNSAGIPFKRRWAKRFINWYAGYLAGRPIPDLNSGLRLFKKEIVFKYWELFPDKFSFTSTLTMICLTHSYEVKFVPIDYYQRLGQSSLRALDFFAFLKLVSKLSLFFKPIKVFAPLSLLILLAAILVMVLFLTGFTKVFLDTTFIVLVATALQTFFFGLLAEIVIHNK